MDLERTGAVESKLDKELAHDTLKATNAEPKLLRAQELASDIRRLNDRYTAVDGMFRSLELQNNGPGTAHVATPAEPPALPESNRRALFLFGALPFGLLLGVAAAVVARVIDPRIYLPSDIEEQTGFAPMAVLSSCQHPSWRLSDGDVLRFAAGLEGAYRRSSARTFVITGLSADTDTSCIIEALVKKMEDFHLRTAVLAAGELLQVTTEIERCRIPSVGERSSMEDTTEATVGSTTGLAAQNIASILSKNDLVFIVGSSLLHSAETEYAARCSDVAILLAESGLTMKSELTAALGLLGRLQMMGMAVVLTGVPLLQAPGADRVANDLQRNRKKDEQERVLPSLQDAGLTASHQLVMNDRGRPTSPIAVATGGAFVSAVPNQTVTESVAADNEVDDGHLKSSATEVRTNALRSQSAGSEEESADLDYTQSCAIARTDHNVCITESLTKTTGESDPLVESESTEDPDCPAIPSVVTTSVQNHRVSFPNAQERATLQEVSRDTARLAEADGGIGAGLQTSSRLGLDSFRLVARSESKPLAASLDRVLTSLTSAPDELSRKITGTEYEVRPKTAVPADQLVIEDVGICNNHMIVVEDMKADANDPAPTDCKELLGQNQDEELDQKSSDVRPSPMRSAESANLLPVQSQGRLYRKFRVRSIRQP